MNYWRQLAVSQPVPLGWMKIRSILRIMQLFFHQGVMPNWLCWDVMDI